jgi:hypothetical protein
MAKHDKKRVAALRRLAACALRFAREIEATQDPKPEPGEKKT